MARSSKPLERGFCIYGINPKRLDRFRDRFTVAGVQRCYGASGEDKASSSLETTDGVPHAAAE